MALKTYNWRQFETLMPQKNSNKDFLNVVTNVMCACIICSKVENDNVHIKPKMKGLQDTLILKNKEFFGTQVKVGQKSRKELKKHQIGNDVYKGK